MAAEVHGGDWEWASARFGEEKGSWLDFSANINPLGPPDTVVAALQRSLAEAGPVSPLARYPDPQARQAKSALAKYLGVDEQCLLITNGGSEALDLAVRLLQPRRVVLVEPCFSEYARAAQSAGAAIVRRQAPIEQDFHWQAKMACGGINDGDALIFGFPNNPTGYLAPRDQLLDFWLAARRRFGLIVDEAFLDFVPGSARLSFREVACQHDKLLVAGSLTKLFALPGLRIGYLVGTEEQIRSAAGLQPAWSVNALAQIALEVAVRDVAFLFETRDWLPRAREDFAAGLAKLPGIRPLHGTANFLLIDIRETGFTSASWQEDLARQGILVRTGDSFSGLEDGFLRVAVRLPGENERLLAAMRRCLQAL